MINRKTKYLEKKINEKLVRAELWFAPLLIILPIIVSIFLIRDWFYRGYLIGSSAYDGELMIALIILIGNIIFDMPFIKSLINLSRKQ